MIETRDLSFAYRAGQGSQLESVSVEVAQGEAVGLEGASGAGKTTLLKLLAGIAPRSTGGTAHGYARIADVELPLRSGDLAEQVGYVPQDPHAGAVAERVSDEIVFTAENLGWDRDRMSRRLEEVAEACGVAHLLERKLSTLSGGERQRVQIASASVVSPQVLLLDEPTSQLDPAGVASVNELLGQLARGGSTMLISEHRTHRLDGVLDRRFVLGARQQRSTLALPQRAPGGPLLTTRGVRVSIEGSTILEEIDLEVREGEALAVTGANGSGKTTLLRAILGFADVRTGSVSKPGTLAWVPQRPEAAFSRETVLAETALTLASRGSRADAMSVLEAHGLEAFAERSPRRLSSGERLRVALCSLTAGEPELILLDEPTRGLDAHGREILVASLTTWLGSGRGVLIATHDEELAALCDRRVHLASGRIVREERAA